MHVGGSVALGHRVCASPCKRVCVGVCVNMRHIILMCERRCVCVCVCARALEVALR